MAKDRLKLPGVRTKQKRPTGKRAGLKGPVHSAVASAEPVVDADRDVPFWDNEIRELRAGGLLVKAFKVPAPNQELILDAFEEEGWPHHMDDPLPPHTGQISKCRIHETIDRLNRNQVNRLIRFRGNGTGRGILWERIADRSPIDRR